MNILPIIKKALITSVVLILAGCKTAQIKLHEVKSVDPASAIVIVANNTDTRVMSLIQCTPKCLGSNNIIGVDFKKYEMSGRNSIMAYAVPVGSKFKLDSFNSEKGSYEIVGIGWTDNQLEINEPGIYFYGSIENRKHILSEKKAVESFALDREIDNKVILSAYFKYLDLFDGIKAINFAPPTFEAIQEYEKNLVLDYKPSELTKRQLPQMIESSVTVSDFQLKGMFDDSCRGQTFAIPNNLSVEKYFKYSLVEELKNAGVYQDDATSTLKGSINEIKFSSMSAYWQFSVTLEDGAGRTFSKNVKFPFSVKGLKATEACNMLEKQFPNAVAYLWEELTLGLGDFSSSK